jgi:hypothetical protein
MSRVLLSCLFLWSISIAGNIISKDAKAAEQQNEQTTDDAGPLSLDGKQRENTDFNPNSGDPVFNNKETKSAVLGFSVGSEKNPDQVISDYYNTDNNDNTESKNLDILPYQKGTNNNNDKIHTMDIYHSKKNLILFNTSINNNKNIKKILMLLINTKIYQTTKTIIYHLQLQLYFYITTILMITSL